MKGVFDTKLNLDLIRDILIAVSVSLSPDEDGVVTQISPYDLAKDELSNYPKNEVLYWMRQLLDSGILVAGSRYIDEALNHCKGDIGAVLGDYNQEAGAWIRFNPLCGWRKPEAVSVRLYFEGSL